MATIDPTQLDDFVANPPDGSGDPNSPTNYLAAVERTYRVPVQGQFTAAKTDIEALETGKEDAGTAAAAVSAHDASATAHGSVEANFGAHDGAGGAAHATATTVAAGFMAGADKTRLDAAHLGENHTGDVTSVGLATTIAADAVTNAKLANVGANTIKGRATTTGDPTDIDIEVLADGGTPAAADVVLGKKQGGDLVKFLGANLGGGSSPLTTKGDIYTYSSVDARLGVGTNGQMLYADSAEATGLRWGDAPTGTGDVTSALATVDGEVQLGDTTTKGIKGSGFQGADVGRLSVANEWAALNTYNGVSASGIYWAASGTPIFAAIHSAGSDLFIQRTTGAGVLDGGGVTLTAGKSVSVGTPAGAGFTDLEGYLNVESAVISSLGSFIENGGTPAEYLHPTKAATVLAAVGYAGTARTIASGTDVPDPLAGQYAHITGTATVDATTSVNVGTTLYAIDNAVTVTWTGFDREVGTEQSGARHAVVSICGGIKIVAHL